MKIAIASGKGGTGKTTLSTNLASFLAENDNVVLVDLDVEEPNSRLFLKGELISAEEKFKMIPEWNKDLCILCGECQKVCNFHAVIQLGTMILVFPELCHSCYACSELCPTRSLPMKKKKVGDLSYYKIYNLNFIESRLIIGEEQVVPLIKQTIEYVDLNFKDYIKIFDSPPGTSCPVIEAVKDADFVILITEPTPFGLNDLKLAVETVRELNKKFAVVINRYGTGNNNVELYCKKEDIPIIAKIPDKREIAELYSRGKLLYNKIPAVKEELNKIKEYLFTNVKGGVK